MPHLAQEIGGRQAVRAAADDGHGSSGLRGDLGQERILPGLIPVGGKALEPGNGHRLVHQGPAAVVLAGMGAHPADGAGQRDALPDQRDGLLKAAVGDQAHIALAVGARRAVEHAGGAAVAHVVGEQQLQVGLAGLQDPLGFGAHHHIGCDLGGAGLHQLGIALHLHHAEAAGPVNGGALVIAEGGDGDIVLPGHLQDGLTGDAQHLFAVDIQSVLFHVASPPLSP